MQFMFVYLAIVAWLGADGRTLQISPTPLLTIIDPSAAATLEEETTANASTSLSNTSLADLQTDNVTQRLQLRYRERKKQERLFLIQAQILQRLGISRQPNITSPYISDDERSRMTQLFEKMHQIRSHINDIDRPFRLYAERMQSFYPSCTLPNNTDRNTWDNQNSFRIFYDVSVPRALINNEVNIMLAKLRLYKINNLEVNPECANWEQNVSALPRYNMLDVLMHSSTTCGLSVSIYQYTKPVRANRRADYRGWVEFNVITSLSQWLDNPQRNYGFDVEVEDAFGNRLIPSHYFRNVNCSDDYVIRDPPFPNIMDIHPEMAENDSSLFDNETYPTLDLQTAELTREEPEPQTVENNDRILKKRSVNHRTLGCRRVTRYVSFQDLGLNEIIINPEGFNFSYCLGNCISKHQESYNSYYLPKNRCVPVTYEPFAVTVINSKGEAKNSTVDNFLVSECGCRIT
ncbi:bone morphogenetic protein 4-like isoform X2 [Centruroides sculpturatus]|uniref:bone morphogenetic protein 4-like isoform X2 n=1 Tax=Centruroides sculpturatus TaxID=218467 RepID=UPI000C6D5281|nr:bone morphogenetic protein 4-like isoform X2 [Centruroides sculpturatus]